ncbi:MAG TPA: hypothetical protein VFK45_09180 [Gammaproteobacteria bacterium]|nr:hypothetical protein [Gammaproteobacteria bacterium]
MKSAEAKLIGQATQNLQLRDIVLFRSRFDRPQLPEPGVDGSQQHKRGTHYVIGEIEGDEDKKIRVLQILVSLGTRVVNVAEAKEPAVFFEIEADFLVQYEMFQDVEEEGLEAFANFNAIHNVWPFWRQHVFDVVQRGKLPKLDIPLFAGAKA